MKKLILLLLVVLGGVMSANATRIYVKIADGVSYDRLYTYDGNNYGYTSNWGDGNALISLGSGWYYIDTWKPFESNIKWILYQSSNESNRLSGESEFIDVKGKYLDVTSGSEASWVDIKYVAYSPTNQIILATLTSTDGVNYSGVVNNQSGYNNSLDMLICPAFMIDWGYESTSKLWEQSFRPWNDYSGNHYSSFTEYFYIL